MLPLELKRDKDGLLYFDDNRILMHKPLLIDNREVSENRYYPSMFYRLLSTDDYIIKYCLTCYTRKEVKSIKEMLVNLIEKQDKIPNVDFPIGYFQGGRRLDGQIIRYYNNSRSYEDILNVGDIELISKYYAHDEDTIRNLFLIFDEVLNRVYEMYENGIYYLDINPGNIVFHDNKAKIIDFDAFYVHFDNKDKRLNQIMDSYCLFLKKVLASYHLTNNVSEMPTNFEEAKTLTKKLENSIRRG